MSALESRYQWRHLIENLEDEIAKDLSSQLYMIHILHRSSPQFPHLRFSFWPLLPESFSGSRNVRPHLMPDSVSRYINEPDPTAEFHCDPSFGVSTRADAPAVNVHSKHYQQARDVLEIELDAVLERSVRTSIYNFNEELEMRAEHDEGDYSHSINHGHPRRHHHHRRHPRANGRLRPRVEPPIRLSAEMKHSVFSFINGLLDDVADRAARTTHAPVMRIDPASGGEITGWIRHLRSWKDFLSQNAIVGNAMGRCRALFLEGNPAELTSLRNLDWFNSLLCSKNLTTTYGPDPSSGIETVSALSDALSASGTAFERPNNESLLALYASSSSSSSSLLPSPLATRAFGANSSVNIDHDESSTTEDDSESFSDDDSEYSDIGNHNDNDSSDSHDNEKVDYAQIISNAGSRSQAYSSQVASLKSLKTLETFAGGLIRPTDNPNQFFEDVNNYSEDSDWSNTR